MTTFRATGSGDAKVLILPGLFGGGGGFDTMLSYADLDRYQYVEMGYRGFGTSKREPGLFTFREVVTDAVRLLDYLGWTKTHLLGHSVGALAAQMIAVAVPTRVASIVSLAGTTARGTSRNTERLRAMSEAASDAAVRNTIINTGTGKRYTRGFVDGIARLSDGNISPIAFGKYAEDAMVTDIQSQIKGSPMPYLAVVGKHDPVNTEALTIETTLRLYKNATLQVIDTGHFPMIECPALTMSLVEQFQNGVVNPSRALETPLPIN